MNHSQRTTNHQRPATSDQRPATRFARTIAQKDLIMQNKPNLQNAQMNVSSVLTKNYENRTLGERGKNKPNSNPIKANLQNVKMNVSSVLTKNYENRTLGERGKNKPNSNPIKANLQNVKMNVSFILTKDCETVSLQTRRQNKANSKPIKPNFNANMPKTNPIQTQFAGLDGFSLTLPAKFNRIITAYLCYSATYRR